MHVTNSSLYFLVVLKVQDLSYMFCTPPLGLKVRRVLVFKSTSLLNSTSFFYLNDCI